MKELPSPDQAFIKMKSQIKPHWSAAFFGSIVIGLLTHMYAMTHHFLTFDSMWNQYSNQNMITSGRQFLSLACGGSSYYDLPWLNGILAILFLAFSSVLLVESFHITNKTLAVLAAGVLVAFPSIASTFCYTYTIDGYMLAVLFAVIAYYITDRYRYGCFVGLLLMGISIGIYQAYFSLTVVACMMKLFLDILDEDKISKILDKVWRYMVMGIGGYAFYVLTLKLMLKIQNVQISGYQGTDRIGSMSLSQIPAGLKTAFFTFLDFARYSNVLTTTEIMKYAFIGLVLLAVASYITLFVIRKRFRSPLRIVMVLVLAIMLPFGATLVTILSPSTYFHLLMRLPWAVLFIFAIALLERITQTDLWKKDVKKSQTIAISVRIAGIICAALLIFQFAVVANIVYFNMNERYEKTYATCLRIVDRLEQMPGYETGQKVAILGGFPAPSNYPPTDITKTDLVGYFGVNGELCVNDTAKYAEFCSHYLNVTLTTIPAQEEIDLTQTEEFMSMEKFPMEGSIQIIGDVWVIKLNG